MTTQITIGSVLTVRSLNGKSVIAPIALAAAVKASTVPAWIQATTDRSSEPGAVLSFRSIL